MLVHSLTLKSRKRLVHDVMYTFAIHASCAHDTTYLVNIAVLMAHVFVTFKMSAPNILEHAPTQKICCDIPLFYSCQQDP